jgi:hypothetical protein
MKKGERNCKTADVAQAAGVRKKPIPSPTPPLPLREGEGRTTIIMICTSRGGVGLKHDGVELQNMRNLTVMDPIRYHQPSIYR